MARWKSKIGAIAALALQMGCATAALACDGGIPWQPVAPSVWVWVDPGPFDLPPISVVVDAGEALIVDPGPSHAHGERVKRSLRCRFGAQAVWIVNTHAHAEHVLGNSAFAREQAAGQVRIGASAATRDAMRQRCPACLASLTARLGTAAMQGTAIVLPAQTLVPGQPLQVGRRTLTVWAVEPGHTEGDLLLWDAEHRVLWVGGLVAGEGLPALAQGSLDGWLAALRRLQALPVRELIGLGWQRAQSGSALAQTQRYLEDLRSGVLQAMDAGRLPQEAGAVPLSAAIDDPDGRHGFNVMRAWRELEPLWMERGSATPSVDEAGR